MKRILLITLALVAIGLSFLGGRKSTEPEYVAPLKHEVPSWRAMRRIQINVYNECDVWTNQDPASKYDERVFGVPDYWQDCRINKSGDCEDYAIAFKNSMWEKYPAIPVEIYFVWVQANGKKAGHAIAIIDHPVGKKYVFDNRFNKLRTLKEAQSHYTGMRETKQDGSRYVFVVRNDA